MEVPSSICTHDRLAVAEKRGDLLIGKYEVAAPLYGDSSLKASTICGEAMIG